jgi:hypothetical protein
MEKITDFINESLNRDIDESAFDIQKSIESAPAWERVLIDFYENNKGVVQGGTGVDCLGRKVSPGDWVIFLYPGGAYGVGKMLSIGKVTSVKKRIQIALILPKERAAWQ